jgi:hypothetical protein
MPRVVASLLAVALGAAAAVAIASCGGDDAKLLAGTTAQEIRENLDSVQRLMDEGECIGAEDEALQVSLQVESLRGIDPKLKQALEAGAARLNEVVDTCEEPEETVEETLPAPTTTESPEEREKQQKGEEKEQENAEKEAEKGQEEAEKEQEKAEKEAEKEQKEAEKEQAKEEAEGGDSSGGIGPGGEAGGGD